MRVLSQALLGNKQSQAQSLLANVMCCTVGGIKPAVSCHRTALGLTKHVMYHCSKTEMNTFDCMRMAAFDSKIFCISKSLHVRIGDCLLFRAVLCV